MENLIDNVIAATPMSQAVSLPVEMPAREYTHEQYIADVRDIVLRHVESQDSVSNTDKAAIRDALTQTKMVYGLGMPRTRGRTVYKAWKRGDAIHHACEVCAGCELGPTQLAGTTIHELAHVIAPASGHGKLWKEATNLLGLRGAKAGGTDYTEQTFAADVWQAIAALPKMTDGESVMKQQNRLGADVKAMLGAGVCSQGIGVRGGTSRGVGSGSRMLRCHCERCGYTARVTRKWLDIGAPICPTDQIAMTPD